MEWKQNMIPNERNVPNWNSPAVERRTCRRHRSLKGARLIYNGGQAVADAVIRDFSETGVRLRLGETLGIPRELFMAVAGEAERRPVHIVWRTPSEMGIRLG